MPVDAVARLERAEQRLVLDELLLAGLDPLIRHGSVDIFADRLHIFGLEVGGLDHFRVGREPLEGAIERGARDAGAFGGGPQAFDASLGLAAAAAAGNAKASRTADPAFRINDLGF